MGLAVESCHPSVIRLAAIELDGIHPAPRVANVLVLSQNHGERIGVSTLSRGKAEERRRNPFPKDLTSLRERTRRKPRTMKAFLLVPKDTPHQCLHVQGEAATHGARIVFQDILPADHPNHYQQVWTFDGSFFRLAKSPNMILYRTNDWEITVYNEKLPRFPDFDRRSKWKKKGDLIFFPWQRPKLWGLFKSKKKGGIGRTEIRDGIVHFDKNAKSCRFEFREIEWNKNKDDTANGLNPQEKKANPTVEPEIKPPSRATNDSHVDRTITVDPYDTDEESETDSSDSEGGVLE